MEEEEQEETTVQEHVVLFLNEMLIKSRERAKITLRHMWRIIFYVVTQCHITSHMLTPESHGDSSTLAPSI